MTSSWRCEATSKKTGIS